MDMNAKRKIAILLINEIHNVMNEDEDFLNSSSDSDEEIIFAAARRNKNKVIKMECYVSYIVANYNAKQFQENFRLRRESFETTLREVAPFCSSDFGRRQVDLKTQLLAVIWLLATPESYRSVSERFNLSKSTLSRCFVRIINALNKLSGKYIKWPTGEELRSVKAKFGNAIFSNVMGAVDGTYVRIKAQKSQSRAYTNRKCFTSMTLQCVSDNEMRFIHAYTGWPSSVPDVRVFKNCDLYLQCQQNSRSEQYFPNGEYILGDKAYPCLHWCISPYMNRTPLTRRQTDFNKEHAKIRVIVENSFALLFGRFRRLRDLDMNRIDWIPATILSCCVLHNICLNTANENVEYYIEEGRDTVRGNNCEQELLRVDYNAADGIDKRNEICSLIP